MIWFEKKRFKEKSHKMTDKIPLLLQILDFVNEWYSATKYVFSIFVSPKKANKLEYCENIKLKLELKPEMFSQLWMTYWCISVFGRQYNGFNKCPLAISNFLSISSVEQHIVVRKKENVTINLWVHLESMCLTSQKWHRLTECFGIEFVTIFKRYQTFFTKSTLQTLLKKSLLFKIHFSVFTFGTF